MNLILIMIFVYLDSVKKMKRYQKYDKIDVEQPIKIFIAGAKCRGNYIKPCQEDLSADNSNNIV